MEPGIGELLANLDQFASQAAQALAFGDFGAQHLGMPGGKGAGGLLAGRVANEAEVRAVTAIALLLAMAGGAAALGVDFAHSAGAQFADGADAGQDTGASLLQGKDGCREGSGGGHILIISLIKIWPPLGDGSTRSSKVSPAKSGRDQNDVMHPAEERGRVRVSNLISR